MDLVDLIRRHRASLPDWVQDWLGVLIPALQIVLIVALAWLLNRLLRRILQRAGQHYGVPDKWVVPLRGIGRWLIMLAALLLVLGRLGVSASVLWTAFTGFAAVGAVAFFAAWSVLSNLFCALLIMIAQPFRLGDDVEVLDSAEKPGAKGRVVDINLLYTTLQEAEAPRRLLQIPNALIFQRVVRRWPGGAPPDTLAPVDAPAPVADSSSPASL
ncbi:MAG TPA: mechanosensitive ion channel [Ottowia sp.]|uniref:mechanosensitive ion channel domain-containing protein n=1 Tax=Ottowia sp. TaxID=1898956 RepID=UPI002CC2750B|nr:mechanosensitive ion channel domain-containing protein [Ottowia sp.]HMN22068.1 mechanosensitive ion channel [Ottowia sp.]